SDLGGLPDHVVDVYQFFGPVTGSVIRSQVNCRCRLTLLARYKEQISFVIEFTLSVPDPSIKAQARVKAVFPVEMQLGGGVAFLQVEFIGLGRHLQSEAAIVVVILVL